MDILRAGERQGVIFQSPLGWHWTVTSGRMAGRSGDAQDERDARRSLRLTWKRGRRIAAGNRQLIA